MIISQYFAIINYTERYIFFMVLFEFDVLFILKGEDLDHKAHMFPIFLDVFKLCMKEQYQFSLLPEVLESLCFPTSLLTFGVVRPFNICQSGWYNTISNYLALYCSDY
jgi:hypothetical protein